jgi:hypothetical protein
VIGLVNGNFVLVVGLPADFDISRFVEVKK